MFKNLLLYRIAPEWQATIEEIEEALEPERFVPCGATQPLSAGWVSPRGIAHAPLVEDVGGHWLLKLQVEQRVLPSSVVRRKVDELCERIEQETGRKPGKKVKNELKEQVTQELLPQAFTKQGATRVWIDTKQRLLMVDAGSVSKADELITLLVKCLPSLVVQLLQTAETPAACMAAWLSDGVPPAGFTVDRECELKSEDEMKSVVRYARHPLDIEEVRQHLAAGKRPTKLALTWRDRVSFLLTDTLSIKKIAFLDIVFEGRDKPSKDEAFDADAALATGELSQLLPDLIYGLGGEHDFAAAALQGVSLQLQKDAASPASPASPAVAAAAVASGGSEEPAPWD